MFLDFKIKKWYDNLPHNNKLAFFATIILGLFCHTFMMTNKWLNLDDIVQLVDSMDRTTSGRWFLTFPSWIGSEFSIPWLNGMLTIIYSSVMASFVVSMFKVKSKVFSILIGGILVTFPTIASLMPFMNTQDSYQFGAMLAVIGAYLLVNYKHGFIWTAILLTLSLGIYQTYLGLAAGLILIYILIKLLENKTDIKEIFMMLINTGISFISAIAIYLFISRVVFGHLLVDYKGLDSMGSIPLSKIPVAIGNAYYQMLKFFIGKEFNYHWPFMPYLFVISILLIFYLVFYLVKKSYIESNRKWFIAFILTVFPLAVNIIYVMSHEAGVMLRMAYSYVVCFIMPLLLIDFIQKEFIDKESEIDENFNYSNIEDGDFSKRKVFAKKHSLLNYGVWFLTITIMLSVYNNIYVSNKTYFKVWITNKTSDAYANRIAMRIEDFPGYQRDSRIVFLGNPDSRTSFTNEIDTRDVEPMIISNHLTRLYSFKYYPKQFLGLPNTIADEDTITQDLEYIREEIESAPLYPAQGSIFMVDGTIYVKFKDIK